METAFRRGEDVQLSADEAHKIVLVHTSSNEVREDSISQMVCIRTSDDSPSYRTALQRDE